MDDLKKYDIKFEYYKCVICKMAKIKEEFDDFEEKFCEACIKRIFETQVIRELKGID